MLGKILDLFRPPRQNQRAAALPTPLRSMSDLDALLEMTGFGSAALFARRLARPCFHLLPDGEQTDIPTGCSRLGGLPDLASGAHWPTASDGKPLTFYGQINLDDVAGDADSSPLPSSGLLSIFAGPTGSYDEAILAQALLTPPGTTLQAGTPDNAAAFADRSDCCFKPVRVRCEAGISLPTENHAFVRSLEVAAPSGDIDALLEGLAAAPDKALGQLLGYAQFQMADVHSTVYFDAIGRTNQERLLIWESWDDWEEAKKMQSRLRNGDTYRPWSASDDENVRWILANRAAIAAGIAQWHAVLWISSNPLMNLWINDADPIYFLAMTDDSGSVDLTSLRAGATQS